METGSGHHQQGASNVRPSLVAALTGASANKSRVYPRHALKHSIWQNAASAACMWRVYMYMRWTPTWSSCIHITILRPWLRCHQQRHHSATTHAGLESSGV